MAIKRSERKAMKTELMSKLNDDLILAMEVDDDRLNYLKVLATMIEHLPIDDYWLRVLSKHLHPLLLIDARIDDADLCEEYTKRIENAIFRISQEGD